MVMTGGWFTIVLPVLSNIIQVWAITYQHDYPTIIIQKLGMIWNSGLLILMDSQSIVTISWDIQYLDLLANHDQHDCGE